MVIVISVLWIIIRYLCNRSKQISWKREAQLILVYICIVVIVRFTFCPFEKIDGKLQPLIFNPNKCYPFRLNLKPFVNMFGYDSREKTQINIIGNIAMFIPVGMVWPYVFKKLNKPWKVIAAGAGFSLAIEILQLPFFQRMTDIDDLILNSLGYVTGYVAFLLIKKHRRKI